MEKVFIYWDNSNIFISAREVASEQEGDTARYRVRIHFRNLLELAHAGRDIERAVAVGSVPPELRYVWNRLENAGVNRAAAGTGHFRRRAGRRPAAANGNAPRRLPPQRRPRHRSAAHRRRRRASPTASVSTPTWS